MSPRCDSVWALYALQNSMMFRPCWPSAGPTGGAGVACPAGSCSVNVVTSFLRGGMFLVLSLMGAPARAPAVAGEGRADKGTAAAQLGDTWLQWSSAGVSRPEIDTRTLSVWEPGLISLIVAGRDANAPSVTVTESPTAGS